MHNYEHNLQLQKYIRLSVCQWIIIFMQCGYRCIYSYSRQLLMIMTWLMSSNMFVKHPCLHGYFQGSLSNKAAHLQVHLRSHPMISIQQIFGVQPCTSGPTSGRPSELDMSGYGRLGSPCITSFHTSQKTMTSSS